MTVYFNPQPKTVRIVSDPLREAAEGQDCALGMPWCNHDPLTVVHCHIRAFGMSGVNQKPQDIHGYHGCSECHRRELEAGFEDLMRAMMITQNRLIQAGIITVKGQK